MKTDERWKIARNVGFLKKTSQKKKENDVMSVVMLQRAGEEKSARVSPRGAARGCFVPEKTVQKKSSKSQAELKTPRKRRKSRRL